MINLGVLASGSGTNLQAIIDAAEKKEISAEVKVVISDRESAYALQRAKKHNIPNYFVNLKNFSSKEEYEREILRILKEHNVDLVVLAGYMKIVGKTLLSAYRNRIMNIHPALLPSFPGLEAWKQAIDYGVKISGVTVHFVDDTPDSLLSRIHQEEYKIYKKAIQLFAEGKLKIEGRKVRILEG